MSSQKTFLVFGGTGQTGQHFVSLALNEGHPVRALARNPAKFTFQSPNLAVHPGAIGNVSDLDALVQGADFVISMLGDVELQKQAKIDTHFLVNYVTLQFSRKRYNQFSERFMQIEKSSAASYIRTAAYLQVSLSLGYGLEEAKQHSERIGHQSSVGRSYISKIIEQAKNKILSVRAGQVRILQRRTQEIAQEMEAVVKDAVFQLKEREAALQKELKAFDKA